METILFDVPDYLIVEQIYENAAFKVYRGQRRQDSLPVHLKVLNQPYPNARVLAQLWQEFEILRGLDFSGVEKAYALENHRQWWFLVLEDFGGRPLDRSEIAGCMEPEEFLRLALQLADIIGRIHSHQVIHKNITPSNISYNLSTRQARLENFGFAALVSKERVPLQNPDKLAEFLPYVSPEMTGRMNRSVDYRTDYYSLGATLYELLTGSPPFLRESPLELVHAHLAVMPDPPDSRIEPWRASPAAFQILSAILLKLLAKDPEDRYLTPAALRADLHQCLSVLQDPSQEETNGLEFVAGIIDHPAELIIPQRVFGREQEFAQLLQAFLRTIDRPGELVLVSGAAGVGKTSLVNQLIRPVSEHMGFFLYAKYSQDPFSDIYQGLVNGLEEFSQQVLSEPTPSFNEWRARIQAAVAPHGQLLTDLCPQLEKVIGRQPPVEPVDEALARPLLFQVIIRFMQAICRPEHPVIIFLDDLQWLNPDSSLLWQNILTNPSIRNLLVVGAYRESEFEPGHPAEILVRKVREAGRQITQLQLQNLEWSQVHRLVAAALASETEEIYSLATQVYLKTEGNPYFALEFLRSLYKDKLLHFNPVDQKWRWDENGIEAYGVASNVVDLFIHEIGYLDEATQTMLKFAACIGRRFDVATLLTLLGQDQVSSLANSLWQAMTEGLIHPLDENYRFLAVEKKESFNAESGELLPSLVDLLEEEILFEFPHDRVQQAALSMLDEQQLKVASLQMGWLLLEKAEREDRETVQENLLFIVDHLNRGSALIEDPVEAIKLAQLNLMAGNHARSAAAFEVASSYLSTGMQILPENCWQDDYTLTLELFTAGAEVAMLIGNLARAETLALSAEANARNPLEKARIINILMEIYLTQTQTGLVIELGMAAIKMLGFDLEVKEPPAFVGEQIMQLPAMTEPGALAVSRFAEPLVTVLFGKNDPRLAQLIYFYINLFSRFGNPPIAGYIYSTYGALILLGQFEQVEQGCLMGRLALELTEKGGLSRTLFIVRFLYYAFVYHWVKPAREAIGPLEENIQSAFEAGDLRYFISSQDLVVQISLFVGMKLEEVRSKQAEALRRLAHLKRVGYTQRLRIWSQFVLKLMGELPDPQENTGELFDRDEAQTLIEGGQNPLFLFNMYVSQAYLSLLFKDSQRALESSSLAHGLNLRVQTQLNFAQHQFVYSLALLSAGLEAGDLAARLEKVEANLRLMRLWANLVPENFLHQVELVEAEQARCLGREQEAAERYERAIQDARQNGYIHESALAAELASEYYLAQGDYSAAKDHLLTAYYSYLAWGAMAKVDDLVNRYPEWLPPGKEVKKEANFNPNTENYSMNEVTSSIDLNTILKASLELTQETSLEELLRKLMLILIENAGAQNGSLVIWLVDRWSLEVQGSIDPERGFDLVSLPLDEVSTQVGGPHVPVSMINYVINAQTSLVLEDASVSHPFSKDAYILAHRPRSVLCAPLLNQGVLSGVVYLENNLVTGAFTPDRLQIVQLISSQAAVSIEKTRLYENLEALVEERTRELSETNRKLKEEIDERVRVEEALRLSETRYRSLFENTGTAMALIDPDGTIALTNEEFLRLTGYSKAELGNHFDSLDLVAPVDRARIRLYRQTRLVNPSGVPASFEFQLVDSSGMEKAVLNTAMLIPGSKSVIISLIDISQRKQAEIDLQRAIQGLQESESRLRLITENAPDFIAELDLEGFILYANRAPAGFQPGGLVGASFYDFIPEEYHSNVKELLENVLLSQDMMQAEFKETLTRGMERWQSARVAPVVGPNGVEHFVLISTDVTPQKWIEEQLRETEEFTRSTLNSLSENIAILDEDGQILWVNQAWVSFAMINGGDPAKTGIGMNYLAACEQATGEDAEVGIKFAGGIRAAIRGEIETFEMEYECCLPEETRWFIGRVTSFSMGNSRRVVVAHDDITLIKQYELALQKSEALYREVVNTQTEVVCRFQPDTTLTFVNEAYCRFVGKTAEELVGQSFLVTLPVETHKSILNIVNGMLENPEIMENELETVHPSGETRWQHWVNKPIMAQGRVVEIQSVGFDITERKKMERLLQENEARLRFALDSAQLAPFDYNLLTGELIWDEHTKVLWGVAMDESPDYAETLRRIHPDDQGRAEQALFKAIDPAGKGDFEQDFRVVWPGGSVHWISAAGKVSFVDEGEQRRAARLVGILRDITERKQAEEALRYNETLLRKVLEILPVGVWIMDKSPKIISVNPQGQRIWGGTKFVELPEFDQYKAWSVKTGERIQSQEWAGGLAVTQGQTTLDEELEIECFDGSHKTILNSAIPLEIEEDGLVGAIIVNQDITQRKRDEEELRTARDQLSTLLQISQSVVSTLDLDRLLSLTIEQLGKVVPFEGAAILILEENFLKFKVIRGPAVFESLSKFEIPASEPTLIEPLIKERQVFYIADLQTEEDLLLKIQNTIKIPYTDFTFLRSWLGLPLMARGELVGVLVLTHSQPDHYSSQSRNLSQAYANQVAIAIHNAQLYEKARDVATLEERARLARELHDSVAQALYSISLFTEATLMALEANKLETVTGHLGELVQLSKEAMADMRLLIFELRPPILEKEGLVVALRSRLESVEARTGYKVELQVEGEFTLSKELEGELYRIAQEALNNVIKHSQANRVSVLLKGEDARFRMIIEDNGIGFDPETAEQAGGEGIRNIRKRMERIGAGCWIESAPGRGAKILIEVNQ